MLTDCKIPALGRTWEATIDFETDGDDILVNDVTISQEGGEGYGVDFNYLSHHAQFVILTACSEAMRYERDSEADSLNDAEVANG
jgi:hypothetical protein